MGVHMALLHFNFRKGPHFVQLSGIGQYGRFSQVCNDGLRRLDEERADRLQAEHEAEQAAKARQRAENREQQRLRMVTILDQQVYPWSCLNVPSQLV